MAQQINNQAANPNLLLSASTKKIKNFSRSKNKNQKKNPTTDKQSTNFNQMVREKANTKHKDVQEKTPLKSRSSSTNDYIRHSKNQQTHKDDVNIDRLSTHENDLPLTENSIELVNNDLLSENYLYPQSPLNVNPHPPSTTNDLFNPDADIMTNNNVDEALLPLQKLGKSSNLKQSSAILSILDSNYLDLEDSVSMESLNVPFIIKSLRGDSTSDTMKAPAKVSEIINDLGLDKQTTKLIKDSGINLAYITTPNQFFKSIAIDPSNVEGQLENIKQQVLEFTEQNAAKLINPSQNSQIQATKTKADNRPLNSINPNLQNNNNNSFNNIQELGFDSNPDLELALQQASKTTKSDSQKEIVNPISEDSDLIKTDSLFTPRQKQDIEIMTTPRTDSKQVIHSINKSEQPVDNYIPESKDFSNTEMRLTNNSLSSIKNDLKEDGINLNNTSITLDNSQTQVKKNTAITDVSDNNLSEAKKGEIENLPNKMLLNNINLAANIKKLNINNNNSIIDEKTFNKIKLNLASKQQDTLINKIENIDHELSKDTNENSSDTNQEHKFIETKNSLTSEIKRDSNDPKFELANIKETSNSNNSTEYLIDKINLRNKINDHAQSLKFRNQNNISLNIKGQLGSVNLQVSLDGNKIHLDASTDSDKIKHIMKHDFNILKAALKNQQLELGNVNVDVDKEFDQDNKNHESFNQNFEEQTKHQDREQFSNNNFDFFNEFNINKEELNISTLHNTHLRNMNTVDNHLKTFSNGSTLEVRV